jgi:hypothetical protein
MSLTVACVFVEGHVPFTTEYVVKLRSMVKRNLDRPHDFVCFTDRSAYLPADMDRIVIGTPRGVYAWWSKLNLFNPKLGLSGRILYLDLDVLITKPLDPIADYPSPFALVPHAGEFNGKGDKKVIKKYNSSVMVFEANRYAHLYTTWSPKITYRLWGDQDFIAGLLPDLDMMPRAWFPRLSQINGDGLSAVPEARVVLAKRPKNADAAIKWPWFKEAWN